ncbi:LETM1 domain containing protein [Pyrenophora teres f. maculata]|nr:LETM1 domain containing protein [Pyrenophora teres f. maculata]
MKSRPMFSTFLTPARSTIILANLQCHRGVHMRAIAPALSRLSVAQMRRHASSTAAPAKRTGYDSATPPVQSSKTQTTNVPTKKNTANSQLTARKAPTPSLVPARSPASKPTTATTVRASERLNPPHFTYAPEITVPARNPDQNIVKWIWRAGRAYVTFYKTGISHVRQTYKLAKTLRKKAAQSPNKDITEVLTRAEWQIVRRSKADVLRLPPFGFLVLALGEWLPLIVMYITPLVPEACRIPQQIQRSLRKMEDKRQDRLYRISINATRLMLKDRQPVGSIQGHEPSKPPKNDTAGIVVTSSIKNWDELSLYELSLVAAQQDCYPALFDWVPFTPPKWLLVRNVKKKMDYLSTDQKLIERDGGWAALSKEEIQRACVERGLPVVGKREDELRKALATKWGVRF